MGGRSQVPKKLQKPQVEIIEIRLRCPECDYMLETARGWF